jgi:hypothetical protein
LPDVAKSRDVAKSPDVGKSVPGAILSGDLDPALTGDRYTFESLLQSIRD